MVRVMPIPYAIAGFLVFAVTGAVLALLWARARQAAVAERLVSRESQLEQVALERDRAFETAESATRELSALKVEHARLAAELDGERKATKEKLRLLEEARDQLKAEFEVLANRIFEARSKKLTEEQRSGLNSLITPFKEQLDKFRQRVDTVHQEGVKDRAALLEQVKTLRELNQQISRDAVNLTTALKGESKTQGSWGELIIERILEQSGLRRGHEYDTQVHLQSRFGGSQSRYPDVVVHLPEKKDVVIDSKVSLTDYERYCSAEGEADRAAALKAHVRSVRNHISGLSAKAYEDLEGINALDLVILCIPSEPAFIQAVSEDKTLYEDAFKGHIMLVGPSTLLLTLRIIATIWRQEYQNRNVQAIADRGQLLYDKFVGFVDDLSVLDKALQQASAAYAKAESKLTSGAGNLVGQAQKLLQLGIKARKQLPPELVERSEAAELSGGDAIAGIPDMNPPGLGTGSPGDRAP